MLVEPGLDGGGFVAEVASDPVGGGSGAEVAPLVEGGEGYAEVAGDVLGGPQRGGYGDGWCDHQGGLSFQS